MGERARNAPASLHTSCGGGWAANFRAEKFVIHYVLWAEISLPSLYMSAPESALSATGGSLPWCPLAEHDPAFAQIVRRHFYMHAITDYRTNSEAAHLSSCVGNEPMLVVECYAKASVWQDLVDLAFHRNELFFCQTTSLRAKNCPLTEFPWQSHAA